MSKSKSANSDIDDMAVVVERPSSKPSHELKTIESWRDELGTPDWLFAGTKLGKRWPIGKELSREDYERAVRWAAGKPLTDANGNLLEGEELLVCR